MKRAAPLLVGLAAVGAVTAACGSGTGTVTEQSVTTTVPKSTTTAPTSTTTPGATPSTAGGAGSPASTGVNVWFIDTAHARTGEEPLFRAVPRQVTPPAVAAGALDALFAGPTAAERAEGLDLILSGATGYAGLHIDNGIAYVRLQGGCSSGGSTMTVAGEIMPTLRQFASVDHVKIYAPDGTTENPTGATDSIPECLEP